MGVMFHICPNEDCSENNLCSDCRMPTKPFVPTGIVELRDTVHSVRGWLCCECETFFGKKTHDTKPTKCSVCISAKEREDD